MRILGIDPGTTESAWLDLFDCRPQASAKESNFSVLSMLRTLPLSQTLLAIEMIASYGMPVGKEVFETVKWIGRFQEAWESRGGSVQMVYRREVKLFHCGSARANDANIRAALLDRYGPGREIAVGTKSKPGPLYGLKGDEWSALAVALTAEKFIRPAAPVPLAESVSDLTGNPF